MQIVFSSCLLAVSIFLFSSVFLKQAGTFTTKMPRSIDPAFVTHTKHFALALILSIALFGFQFASILVPIAAFALGMIWKKRRARGRKQAIREALPFFLEFTSAAVSTGLDVISAIRITVENDPGSSIKTELDKFLELARLGFRRDEAFSRLADQTGVKEFHVCGQAMRQSEELGTSLGGILRFESEKLRSELVMKAEENAQKAPVKMLLPLVLLIFPVTFLLIFYPLYYRVLTL